MNDILMMIFFITKYKRLYIFLANQDFFQFIVRFYFQLISFKFSVSLFSLSYSLFNLCYFVRVTQIFMYFITIEKYIVEFGIYIRVLRRELFLFRSINFKRYEEFNSLRRKCFQNVGEKHSDKEFISNSIEKFMRHAVCFYCFIISIK